MSKVSAEIEIPAKPQRVIDAFLRHLDIQGWWGISHSLVEPKAGGVWLLAWGRGAFQYVASARIGALKKGKLLRHDQYCYLNPEVGIFGPMTLTVEAKPKKGGGTVVRVTQGPYGSGPRWKWYYEATRSAWPQVLCGLAGYLQRAGKK